MRSAAASLSDTCKDDLRSSPPRSLIVISDDNDSVLLFRGVAG